MRNQAKTGHPTWKENRGSSFATHGWHCLCVDGLRHRTSQLDLIARLHYVFNLAVLSPEAALLLLGQHSIAIA